MQRIYLDNNRTTAVDPQVLAAMKPFLEGSYADLHALHSDGARSRKAYNEALEKIYATLHAGEKDSVFFCSGAAEANSTVFYSTYINFILSGRKNSIIIGEREPLSILQIAEFLESQGVRVHRIPINGDGVIEHERLLDYITPRTALVSVSMVDGESGAIEPIDEIAAICRRFEVPLHCDATHAVGKIALDLQSTELDYLTFSSETLHAPAGTGVLYMRKDSELLPLVWGGRSEAEAYRGGPLNIAGIAALGKAVELAVDSLEFEMEDVRDMRDMLEERLKEIEGVHTLVPWALRVPNTLLVAIEGVESEALLYELDKEGVSAYSYTVYPYGEWIRTALPEAMGLQRSLNHTTVGFALSRYNSEEEMERTAEAVKRAVEYLRSFMPSKESL